MNGTNFSAGRVDFKHLVRYNRRPSDMNTMYYNVLQCDAMIDFQYCAHAYAQLIIINLQFPFICIHTSVKKNQLIISKKIFKAP